MKTKVVVLLLCLISAKYVNGMATLGLPKSANCLSQSVLTCTSIGCYQSYKFIKNGVSIYNHFGPAGGIDPGRYNGTVTSNSTAKLTITDIQLSDAGNYACACGFDNTSTSRTLPYTCLASASTVEIMSDKTLRISVDELYPQPQNFITNLTSAASKLPGTHTCEPSPTLDSHYMCTWVSTASLPDGNHNYTIMVDTAQVYGSFRIVTPSSPTISNLTTNPNNDRQVLRGKQDTPLTIECVSRGGIPAPTLAWHSINTSTLLAQSNTSDSIQQPDGTYTVILAYGFTPSITDNLMSFCCQLFYPDATSGASPYPAPATALLYLDLKPDIPTVSQTGQAASGGSMTLLCKSASGRPAPSITWFYRGQTFSPTNTMSLNQTSETYTVVSVLQRPVNAEDNGLTATCSMSHTTLSAPLNKTVQVDVKFGPSEGSTTISGNQETAANGTNTIRLNCTSGSSNPASYITWYNGSDVIENTSNYTRWSGRNNGMITSHNLTITPTRYMDGSTITCRPHNVYGVDSKYISLSVFYSPLIQPLLNITTTEGQPDFSLTCTASSKPPAKFSWYKDSTILASSTNTLTVNSFSYVIARVDRTDSGSYRCQADNNVGIPDSKSMYVFVQWNDSRHRSSSDVALIAGVVSGVFVLVAVSVVVFLTYKRRKANKRRQKGKDTRHLEEDSNSSAIVVECVMYESAGNVQPGSSTADLYSKSKKKCNTPVADVYSVVSKPKKGLYENAPKPVVKNVDNFSPMHSKVSEKTKKNANTDGLVYAELEFNKSHEKSVIHGLDDATTYVQVDFTKAADPLPECDEEPNVNK